MMKMRLPSLARNERGAAVIELALVAPVLGLMVIGIVDLSNAFSHKLALEQKYEELFQELQRYWKLWDRLIEPEQSGQAIPAAERQQALDKLVDVLNRRNYIRNLVRDVNEVLEQ